MEQYEILGHKIFSFDLQRCIKATVTVIYCHIKFFDLHVVCDSMLDMDQTSFFIGIWWAEKDGRSK